MQDGQCLVRPASSGLYPIALHRSCKADFKPFPMWRRNIEKEARRAILVSVRVHTGRNRLVPSRKGLAKHQGGQGVARPTPVGHRIDKTHGIIAKRTNSQITDSQTAPDAANIAAAAPAAAVRVAIVEVHAPRVVRIARARRGRPIVRGVGVGETVFVDSRIGFPVIENTQQLPADGKPPV